MKWRSVPPALRARAGRRQLGRSAAPPTHTSPTMPLTPLRRRKLSRMFAVLDLDGDGFVGRADFLRRVEAFARLRGWGADAPEYLRNRNASLEEWQGLCQGADVDDDGRVSRDEFLAYADTFLADRDAVRAYARGDVQLLFDAMDTDGDGVISTDEYRAYLEVCGVETDAADAFFLHAALDRDGRITRTEMSHAMEEFLVSDDPRAGGNFLFGDLGTGDA